MSLDIQEVILAKSETTYNRDPGLDAATDAIMVEGLTVSTPDAKMIERNPVSPAMGAAKAVFGGSLLRSVSFKLKLKGSGAGTTPPEAAVILKAAGFSETVGASDVSYAISSLQTLHHKSATFHYYEGAQLHKLTGAHVEKLDGNLEVDGTLDVTVTGHTCEWGIAQAGTTSSITLASDHAAVDGIYIDQKIRIIAGTGVGQESTITAYTGTTREAAAAFATPPDTTSVYVIDNGPIDSTQPTPTYDSTVEPPVVGMPFKVGSYPAVINNLTFSAGIKLIKAPSLSSPDGFGTLRLGPRAVTGSIEPELDTVVGKDWLDDWKKGIEADIDTGTIGTTAGNCYRVQLLRASQKAAPTQGSRDGIRTRKLEFQADGRTADGELVITFS